MAITVTTVSQPSYRSMAHCGDCNQYWGVRNNYATVAADQALRQAKDHECPTPNTGAYDIVAQ